MTSHRLYFAQHGLAVDKAENPERPLSDVGSAQTRQIASQLRNSQVNFSKIFHSGKLRAAQTAEIFAEQLNVASVSAIDSLAPNGDIHQTTRSLDAKSALYVGHLPHLDKLISHLITGNENSTIIKLQNSAVLCLENTNTHFQILWYLTPDLFTAPETK